MRYQMKEKWFSIGDNFVIRDEYGAPALVIEGKIFSWGDDLSVHAPDGGEIARIRQQLFSWGPTYDIQMGGQVAATIRKEWFTFFHDAYTVDVPGPDDLKATGNFWDLDYSITRHGQQVAQVSREFFSMSHTYGIDIAQGENELLILCTVVVIDLCNHKKNH